MIRLIRDGVGGPAIMMGRQEQEQAKLFYEFYLEDRVPAEPIVHPRSIFSVAERMVRIHLPPAESQVRTCLSREFAFLRREAAVFRGCAPLGWRRGRRRRAGWSNIALKNGNISVGPYSSTAVLRVRFGDRGGAG